MEIHLKPELVAIVEQAVAAGQYESAEAYVNEAIEQLDLRKELEKERELFRESMQQADNGELFTEEEVRRDLMELEAQFLARQSAA